MFSSHLRRDATPTETSRQAMQAKHQPETCETENGLSFLWLYTSTLVGWR